MESAKLYSQWEQTSKPPTYGQFQELYHKEKAGAGWFGRKVTAIPRLLFTAIVKTVYHCVQVVFKAIVVAIKAVFESPEVKEAAQKIAYDFQEAMGYLNTIGDDIWGCFLVGEARLRKGEGKAYVDIPDAPPPPGGGSKGPSWRSRQSAEPTTPAPRSTAKVIHSQDEILRTLKRIMEAKKSLKEHEAEVMEDLTQGERLQKELETRLNKIKHDVQNTPTPEAVRTRTYDLTGITPTQLFPKGGDNEDGWSD